ncbi:hypothetical protein AVEN_100570-1 [Araneus ventricosus]|uniref:Uncharacterized protein n=1 Tax=Araneus ventricosus TaxID=182803 RepID=A0A4Y2FIF3_ARAVE|nr:hypothetical protein AVEN_100570-1 [Araneus ventricosus]
MLSKLIFCAFLAAARTCGSHGSGYNQQAPSVSPQFLDLPSFDTKSIVGQPTTINHKSFIEHVSSGTGSSSGSGRSSNRHTTGTRSSTLLNKAIAEQGAVPDSVILPSSSTNVQATPPNFSSVPIGIFSNNYANSGILSAGLFGTSIDKAVGTVPSILSLNSRIDHSASGSISTVPNGIPSLNSNKDGILSTGFLNTPFDKINVPVPEIISVSVSSSTDDGTPVSLASSPPNVPAANYAKDGILSTGQFGTSLGKDVISIPNAVSVNYVNGHGAPGSVSAVAVPVKVSSSVGPAESSFLSSFGAVVEKTSAVSTPDSISLRKVAAVQNEAPSVNYAAEKVLAGPVVSQSTISNPTTLASQASIDKYLSTPASDILGLLGNGYNSNPNGILSSGFLGAPISSTFGLTGKELSTNGLFSLSNIGNNGNLGGALVNVPVVGNKEDPINKFETVIQHAAPVNAVAAPMAFNGINNNNLFNGLIGNGFFADPLGFPNGLFGSTYNGINGFGAGDVAVDNVFSKYLWR